MSRLTELLSAVKDLNPKIGEELAREVGLLQQRTSYGLMFERHQPEAVELPGHPVRAGDKVRLLPPRGSAEPADPRLWVVQRARSAEVEVGAVIDGGVVTRTVPRYDAVLVAEFQDPIYPGLRVDETVVRGGDKPFHTVINGENFHALELLTFTHEHAVDVIYIDPPYNSGATDWKYNNDYVGTDDEYRHSKWLAFMERRLKLAKRLLRNDGVIVITIDEHEVIRLGGLLEQVFEGWKTQLVTIVSNPKGVTQEYFSRVEEYAFFVFAPEARIGAVDDDLLTHRDEEEAREAGQPARPRWKGLLRSGDDSLRADRKDMFYPIWIDPSTRKIARVGEPLPLEQEPDVEPVDGLVPVWPIRKDLKQGRWGVSAATLRSLVEQGFVAVGREDRRRRTWAVSYLSKQIREEIELGLLRVRGHDPVTGVADVEYVDTASRRIRTVWHRSRHDAGAYGKDLIGALLGGTRTFPFPKSLYAVEDALRPLVIARPEAVVLDFFAGSGTTAHAVMRLNRQDGGRRQCILVTNNEVSADEQEKLRKQGLRPGDPEWERWGICDYITKPRIRAAITGRTPDGEPIKGDYKFVDEFPMAEGFAENAAFVTLTYESPWLVNNDKAFERIAPLLWLRAGARGELIRDIDAGWAVTDAYGILRDLDQAAAFVEAVRQRPELRVAFVVTDDEGRFQQVVAELPGLEHVRLYAEYLRNFELTGDVV